MLNTVTSTDNGWTRAEFFSLNMLTLNEVWLQKKENKSVFQFFFILNAFVEGFLSGHKGHGVWVCKTCIPR